MIDYKQAEAKFEEHMMAIREAGLNERQQQSLRRVTDYRNTLRRYLEDAKSAAENALARLEEGKPVSGSRGFGHGPLGHQLPFDIASATQKLDAAVDLAMAVGVPTELIEQAYALDVI